MAIKTQLPGVVELTAWPPSEAAANAPINVLVSKPPHHYWFDPSLQADPRFDIEARDNALTRWSEYLNYRKELAEPGYPLRAVRAPYNGLPVRLNDSLLVRATTGELTEQVSNMRAWLKAPYRMNALFGANLDLDSETPRAGEQPQIVQDALLWTHYPIVPIDRRAQRGEAGDRVPPATAHVRFQQWHRGQWPVFGGHVTAHSEVGSIRCSVTSSYLPLRPRAEFATNMSSGDAHRLAEQTFEAYRRELPLDKGVVKLAPYAGREACILAFSGHFWLAYRFEWVNDAGNDAWRVFIDATNGIVLGRPERLVAQANTVFFATCADALVGIRASDASLSLGDLQAELRPLCGTIQGQNGASYDLSQFPDRPNGQVPAPDFEAANVAYHTRQIVKHFTGPCGADPNRLINYDYTDHEVQVGIFGPEVVDVLKTQAPPLQITVGAPTGTPIETGFNAAETCNPKAITFLTAKEPTGLSVNGLPVYNPALDPEVIRHEMTHAIMWLLNRSPFEQQSESVPFSDALLEGYATYFARSLAARHAQDSGANPEKLWGNASYRKDAWGNEWGFARQSRVAGADVLPAPNLYPEDVTTGLPVYDLGMVWARVLWDIRGLLPDNAWGGLTGPDLADHLALDGYYRCHGWTTNFEVAAEGMIDSARAKGVPANAVDSMIAAFVARGILAERGIRTLCQLQNAQGGIEFLMGRETHTFRSADGEHWVDWGQGPAANPPPRVVALTSINHRSFLCTENGPVLRAVGDASWHSDPQWSVWPSDQTPLSMAVIAGAQPVLLVGTGLGVHAPAGGWDHWDGASALLNGPAWQLAVAEVPRAGGSAVQCVCAALLTGVSCRRTDNSQLGWVSPGQVPNALISAIAAHGPRVYAGTLADGIWRQELSLDGAGNLVFGAWAVVATAAQLSHAAVLCLALTADGSTLWAGTTGGVYEISLAMIPANLASVAGVPAEATVLSVLPMESIVLVGTVQHGLFLRRPGMAAFQGVNTDL